MEPLVGQQPQRLRNDAEQRWLAAFQGGDPDAFQPLVRPHLTALLALARRHCRDPHWAEDLVQETLVRAFKGLAGFRGDAALRTWLFRILVRLAADPNRWRKSERAGPLPTDDVPDHYEAPPEHGAIDRELSQRLEEAMERLTARQRSALHLRAVEGLDYAAVSAILECSQTAARMLVLEARRKVMARLQEHLEP
ncbi:MAG: RNA polymerase sigma factor [Planctomycetes bacterium]|nr:RNA polymerase sigma factor [Planctomycetota bacterium]